MFRTKQEVDKHVNNSLKKINNETERNLRCFSFAKLYYNVGDYEQTVRYVTSYLSVKPKSPEGHNLLGKALEKLGKKDAALEAYRTSLQQDPKQNNLVIKVCELMAQDDVEVDNSGARYFCDLAQTLDPQNPIVSTLKEKLITNDSKDPHEVSKFLIKELENRPTDVILRVRLLKHFLQNNMVKEAYKHASDIEQKKLGIFENSLPWYEAFAEVLVKYQRDATVSTQLTWEFWFLSVSVLEKLAALSLDEHQENVKSSIDYIMAVFNFDQSLLKASQNVDSCPDKMLLKEFLGHYEAQLCLHLSVVAFKQAKKQMMSFKEAQNVVLPLLFISYNVGPPDLQAVWFNNSPENRRKLVVSWHGEGSFRCSQAGHILLSFAKDRRNILLDKANQYSTGMWREQLFKKIFVKRDQQLKTGTSFFISSTLEPVIKLPDYGDVLKYDEVAQTIYPGSLHHYIWLALNSPNISDFKLKTFDGLQYTVKNLNNSAAESINVLDVQSFIYCAALCAQSKIKNADNSLMYFTQDRPSVLPVSITGNLGTLNQTKFVSAAYSMYRNEHSSNMGEIRLLLIKGIEVIRCVGNHGLDIKLLVTLATVFSERAKLLTKQSEIEANSSRAELYWKTALPLLERLKNNHAIVYPNNRLFEYKSYKDLTREEIGGYIEKAKLFLGVQLMKKKEYEKATHIFESLKDPYASFYQSQIYKHMADSKTSQNKENVTSEMRSQNIILLSRARDCLYLTLDRLREPSQDRDHPLNAQLGTEIEKIERLLSRIDPDCTNRNECDGMSDENVSDSSVGEHYLSTYTHHTSFHNGRDYSGKHDTPLHSTPLRLGIPRQEARPSPERLDAQLRQLTASKDLALNSVMEQNKMMTDLQKSLMEEIRGFKDAVKNLTVTVDEQAKKFTGCFEDVRQVKKSVDELTEQTNSVDDRIQSITDMVQEMRKELNEIKKDHGKNAQLSVEDLYELGNDPEYNAALDYNLSSNLGNAQANLNSMVGNLYPHFQPPRLAQGITPNLAAYGGQALYPGLFPGLPYPYGALGLAAQPFLAPLPADQQQLGQLGTGLAHPVYQTPPNANLSMNSMILGTQTQGVPVQAKESPKTNFTSAGLSQTGFNPSVAPPVNVVITSSDPLPSITTTTTQPVLSVIIPPQHIKGNIQKVQVASQVIQSPAPSLAHNYQIPLSASQMVSTMPSVLSQPAPLLNMQSLLTNVPSPAYSAIAKVQSPGRNVSLAFPSVVEKSLDKTDTSLNRSNLSNTSVDEYDPRPDFKPLIPLPDEVPVNTGEEKEMELFSQRGKLFRLAAVNEAKEWKERGIGNIKILFNPETRKVRVLMRREQVHKICANHFLNKNSSLAPMANNDRAYIWAAHDYSDGEIILEKFCVRFKTAEEAKKFADAFDLAVTRLSEEPAGDKSTEITKEVAASTPKTPLLTPETSKPTAVLPPVAQTNLGGFKFTSTPTFKPTEEAVTTPKVEEVKAVAKEPVHVGPFAGFTFGTKTTATPKHGLESNELQFPQRDDHEDSHVDDFVPTAEFKPVIEKIPDLVDVKTGEENAEILFDERAKLFRYDSSGETNEWKERGLGNIKILKENAIRLVMRREQVHKVCLNHQVLKNMSFKQNSTNPKVVIWHAQDFSEGVLKPETFSVRFKTEELASKFLRTLQSLQTTMDENNQETGKHHKPEALPKTSGFGDKFKAAKGSWECKNCYITNEGKTNHCIACDTPRVGVSPKKEEPTFSFGVKPAATVPQNIGDTSVTISVPGWGDKFKPAEGTWECKMCLVRNSADKTNCMSCETPKDGAEAADTKPGVGGLKGISLDTGGQTFTFGIPAASSPAKPPVQKTETTAVTTMQKIEQPIQKFSFSVPPPPTISDPNAVLSGFGDSFKPKIGTWECKTCYIRNEPSSQYCLSCETPKDDTVPKKEAAGPKGVNLETPGIKFSFGMPATTISQNISANFAFGDTNATKSTFSWKPSEPIAFDNAPQNEAEKSEQFVFGSPQKHDFEFKPRGPRRISSGQGDESDASYVEEEEEANVYFKPVVPLPDIVEVKTGEENEEVLYSHRAKLFRFVGGEWKERGIGDVKLLEDGATGKLRVVMRREQVLKICLNHWLTKDVEYLPKDEKTWLFHAADFSEGALSRDQFCLRFKNADIAQDFKKALDNALGVVKIEEISDEGKKPSETNSQDSDSDVEFVSETVVTAEEEMEAVKLGLPPKFFAYRQRPDCTCEQCKKEDEYLKELFSNEPSAQKLSEKVGSVSSTLFGTPITSSGTPSSGSLFGTPIGQSFTFTTPTGQTSPQPQKTETLKDLLQKAPLTPKGTSFTFKRATPVLPQTTPTSNAADNQVNPTATQVTPSDQSKPSFNFAGSQQNLFGQNNQNVFGTANVFNSSSNADAANLFKPSSVGSILGDGTPKEGSTPSIFGSNTPKEESRIITTNIFAPTTKPSIFGNAPSGNIFATPQSKDDTSNNGSSTLFGGGTPGQGNIFTVDLTKNDAKTNIFATPPPPLQAGDAGKNATNLFGAAKTNLFGTTSNSTSATNLFRNASTTSTGSGIFSSAAGSGNSSNTSIFASAGGGASSTGSIFGGGTRPTQNIFGTSTQGSIFGATLFGSKTEPKVTDANLSFGSSTTTNLKESDEPVLKVKSDLSFANFAAESGPKTEQAFTGSKMGDEKTPFAFLGAGAPVFGGKIPKKPQKSPSKNKTDKEGSDHENEGGEHDDKEHDPHFEPIVPLPDQIVVSTGEEDETVMFNERAKLFRYDDTTREWKERGVGQIKVLYHPQNQSYRLLLRREQVHKVVLNQRITPDLDIQPMVMSDKAMVWAGYNYTDDESNLERLAIRFKSTELALAFKNSVEDAVQKVVEIQANKSQQSDTLPITVQEFGLEDVSNEDIQNYDDDVEDEEEDEDDEDDDDDDRSIMFTKRCTLNEQDDSGSWRQVGMGELQVYYDPELYAARISVADDEGEVLSNTIIGLNTLMEIQGKECWWKSVEWAHADNLQWRSLKATFSSAEAAQEFHSNYLEGINFAQEVGIVDELPNEGDNDFE